jgi:hypothetical protein
VVVPWLMFPTIQLFSSLSYTFPILCPLCTFACLMSVPFHPSIMSSISSSSVDDMASQSALVHLITMVLALDSTALIISSIILESWIWFGKTIQTILCMYCIEDMQIEPHHQHQNPAERQIQDIKKVSNYIMDRTGTPSRFWSLSLLHTVYILNQLSTEFLIG